MKEIILMSKLINKMGWQKIPASVALAAIRTAVRNHGACMQDCTGETMTVLQCLQDLNVLSPEGVWLSLYVSDYQTLHDKEGKRAFLYMREEIEREMLKGMSLEEAREEWDV